MSKPAQDIASAEVTDLREQLAKYDQDDIAACRKEIEEVLEKWGCVLAAQPAIAPDGRIGAAASIFKKPPEPPGQPQE